MACNRRMPEGILCTRKWGHDGSCAHRSAPRGSHGPGKPRKSGSGRIFLYLTNEERMHGIGVALWWAETWRLQDGKCYLCGDELSTKRRKSHIDHDHLCCPQDRSCENCRRGIACAACNQIIGLAKEDPDKLIRIAQNMRRIGTVSEANKLF